MANENEKKHEKPSPSGWVCAHNFKCGLKPGFHGVKGEILSEADIVKCGKDFDLLKAQGLIKSIKDAVKG